MVRPALRPIVVGRADARERAAEPLVPEVELDLLERALHEERRHRVRDRVEPLHREAGRDPDERLFHDPDVDHPVGCDLDRSAEPVDADLGKHHGDVRIALDQVGGRPRELGAHVGHHSPSGMSAITAFGRSGDRSESASYSCSWS